MSKSNDDKYSDNNLLDANDNDFYRAESKDESNRIAALEKKSQQDDKSYNNSLNALDDDDIIERLQKFFFEDEDLAKSMESFIDSKSDVVDLDAEEYRLQYTEIFNDYKRLFEERIEDFIATHLQCTSQRVYDALKSKVDADENSMESFFAQLLIAVTDFEVFMTMMKESAKKFSSKSTANSRVESKADRGHK